MKTRSLLCLFAASLSLGVFAPKALADTLSLTLTNPTAGANLSGGTANYYATITAGASNTGLEYLNGLTDSFAGPFAVDLTPFNNTPFFLAAGQSYSGLLFDLLIPANSTIASYAGSVTLLYGGAGVSANTSATASFSTAVTPEPSTWLLLGTGVFGMGLLLRRRNTLALNTPTA